MKTLFCASEFMKCFLATLCFELVLTNVVKKIFTIIFLWGLTLVFAQGPRYSGDVELNESGQMWTLYFKGECCQIREEIQ